jgi:hypothetical protein
VGTAASLRAACRPGQTVLSPPDIGLYVGALTSCWPYVSHRAAPEFEERLSLMRAFYDAGASAQGEQVLRRICPDHVVLPPAAAGAPGAFVGADGVWSAVLGPPRALPVYTRRGACPAP